MIEVSPRIIVNGDKVKGAAYLRAGRRELAKLEAAMAFNQLEQGSHGPVQVSADGVTVEVVKRFDERIITINVPEVGGGQEEPRLMCLCNCNVSLGWIVRKQDDFIDGAPLYTVMACQYKRRHKLFRDVLASGWAEYLPGQKVLLMPYLHMAYLCCADDRLLYGEQLGYGCRGLESTEPKESEDWRTAYRILPYMAARLPRRIEVRNG